MTGYKYIYVSQPWLSPLRGWGSLTMRSTGKFVYMAHHFILLRINPFGLRVDRWFEHSMSQLQVCLSAEGAKNVSRPWLSPLRGWGSLTITSTGKFVYIYIYIYIDRQIYIYRQIDRQREREGGRERQTERETERINNQKP